MPGHWGKLDSLLKAVGSHWRVTSRGMSRSDVCFIKITPTVRSVVDGRHPLEWGRMCVCDHIPVGDPEDPSKVMAVGMERIRWV